ncbi:hypothetical protein [Phenylobacterium sp.]|uniref:hypothetical protein n=1 Tax=Phenylobacterium sp. TaxID=1871053 RepID=UPI00260B26AE|nr:hypothetical protein [Phenylobacterium sp.]
MAEVDFERRLERLFADAPELPDAAAFAGRVERRLNTGWTARRWLIGAAGVGGGIIGASQIVMSNLVQRVESAGDSAKVLSAGLTQITPRAEWLTSLYSGGAVVWIASALAIVAMGFALSRVIEEL